MTGNIKLGGHKHGILGKFCARKNCHQMRFLRCKNALKYICRRALEKPGDSAICFYFVATPLKIRDAYYA